MLLDREKYKNKYKVFITKEQRVVSLKNRIIYTIEEYSGFYSMEKDHW